jgi:hypothetical protein
MAIGQRIVSDALRIMRVGLGRRNQNDPEATDNVLFRYLNDFVSLSMPNDTKLFESFGTLSFTIDEANTTGVYTFNDVGAEFDFINTSLEAFISLLDPVNNSISWNWLPIYQDPGEFYSIWGINNEEILIKGYPTMMLYYGTEMVFRTIPNTAYLVKIYGYKKNNDYPSFDTDLQFDYWLRYVAYGAMVNYARDYRYSAEARSLIEATFKSERKLQLTHTHNQIKNSRAMPRF